MSCAAARSLLFAPGTDERKLARAAASGADAVIADLEDSVAAAAKEAAREVIARAVPAMAAVTRMVRINPPGSAFFEDDLALVRHVRPDAVILPKAIPESAAALAAEELPIIAIVETAVGVRAAYEIAATANVVALMLGAIDLAAELGLQERRDGLELAYFRSKLVTDSAAAGRRAPIDSVYPAVKDADGLREHARAGRALGMGGKACIHPAQVEIVNRIFEPDQEAIEWAHRVVAAAEAAAERDLGVIALDGRMVDAPVISRARQILEASADRPGGAR